MTANLSQQQRRFTRLMYSLPHKYGRKIFLGGVPGGVNRLFAVERIFSRHALTPSFGAVRMQCDQQNAALRGASEAGLKEMDQGHTDFAHSNCFNSHVCSRLAAPDPLASDP